MHADGCSTKKYIIVFNLLVTKTRPPPFYVSGGPGKLMIFQLTSAAPMAALSSARRVEMFGCDLRLIAIKLAICMLICGVAICKPLVFSGFFL